MDKWWRALAVAITALPLFACGSAGTGTTQAAVLLRQGCSQPKGSLLCTIDDHFAKQVEIESKGRLKVQVYYQSLGAEQELLQNVVNGSVDIGQIANGNVAQFTSAFLMYDLPFLFKTYDNMLDSLDTQVGKSAISKFETDLPLKFLFPIDNGGGRDIQTSAKQLKVPADIRGLKMRTVASPVDLFTFKAWGANPTPIAYSQVPSALRTGVVEGMQATSEGLLNEKLYENGLKYDLRLDYQALFSMAFINKAKYASLSVQDQKALSAASTATKVWEKQYAHEVMNGVFSGLTKAGVAVYMPTRAEYAQWASVRQDVWNQMALKEPGKIDFNAANQLYQSQQ